MIIALCFSVLTAFCLVFMAPEDGWNKAYFLWVLSFYAELIIIANVAFFFSMVLSSSVASVLITGAFYLLSRMMGQILGIIERFEYGGTFSFMETIMLGISTIIPRLDLMAQSGWLLYGTNEDSIGYGFIILQALVFSFLILSAAMIDLKRKQF